ncbi:MAG: two-component system sensor histidine kinase/response regulator [Myxococcota bacterium]|jgi:signal transduction histidine kinase
MLGLDDASARAGVFDFMAKHRADEVHLPRCLRFAVERGRAERQLSELGARLQDQNAELAKLGEQRNRFLGIAAHDLRSPLSVILAHTAFLQRGGAG